MKVSEALDQIISTYNELLSKCYEALDPNADQATRDKLRQAIGEYLGKGNADTVASD
jgi:hypothetical protein